MAKRNNVVPEPDFTLVELLKEVSSEVPEEAAAFTSAELGELINCRPRTAIRYLKILAGQGWRIEPTRKEIINFAGQRTTVAAYRLIRPAEIEEEQKNKVKKGK